MRQFGARSFDLDIDTGKGTLLPPVGEPLLTDALRKAVGDAGFELLGLELEILGLLRNLQTPTGENQAVVEAQISGQRFALIQGHSEDERTAWARIAPQLDRNGVLLWVRGRVHEHEGGPPALQVNDFRFLED